uniref:Putative secreted protein n=1 Tax=Anopheles marajoara TaxID=58244 RepID=A0A2M4C7S9_9DIPT
MAMMMMMVVVVVVNGVVANLEDSGAKKRSRKRTESNRSRCAHFSTCYCIQTEGGCIRWERDTKKKKRKKNKREPGKNPADSRKLQLAKDKAIALTLSWLVAGLRSGSSSGLL